MWSIMVNGSLRACNFPGTIYYVNPRSDTVHGQPTEPSLTAAESKGVGKVWWTTHGEAAEYVRKQAGLSGPLP